MKQWKGLWTTFKKAMQGRGKRKTFAVPGLLCLNFGANLKGMKLIKKHTDRTRKS